MLATMEHVQPLLIKVFRVAQDVPDADARADAHAGAHADANANA